MQQYLWIRIPGWDMCNCRIQILLTKGSKIRNILKHIVSNMEYQQLEPNMQTMEYLDPTNGFMNAEKMSRD